MPGKLYLWRHVTVIHMTSRWSSISSPRRDETWIYLERTAAVVAIRAPAVHGVSSLYCWCKNIKATTISKHLQLISVMKNTEK